jgi:copper chaperone CopZ
MRVSSILNEIEAVLQAEANSVDHTATVTYDTRRTEPEIMKEALAKNDFPVESMRFLK